MKPIDPFESVKLDLGSVTTPRSVMLYFTNQTTQILNVVMTKDFQKALKIVEETLNSYQLYTEKQLLVSSITFIRVALTSFESCWKLARSIFMVLTKKKGIQQLNLNEIKEQIMASDVSSATIVFSRMLLELLIPIFMDNYLMVGANSCIQLWMRKKAQQFKVDGKCSLLSKIEDMEVQIKFLIRVFEFSDNIRRNENFEYEEGRDKDEIFDDLLNSLDAKDYCKMPSVALEKQEVQQVYLLIYDKVRIYRDLKKKAENELCNYEKQLITINHRIWIGQAQNFMCSFEDDPEKKHSWLEASIKTLRILRSKFFTTKHIHLIFKVEPDQEMQDLYKIYLQTVNENTLMQIERIEDDLHVCMEIDEAKELGLQLATLLISSNSYCELFDKYFPISAPPTSKKRRRDDDSDFKLGHEAKKLKVSGDQFESWREYRELDDSMEIVEEPELPTSMDFLESVDFPLFSIGMHVDQEVNYCLAGSPKFMSSLDEIIFLTAKLYI